MWLYGSLQTSVTILVLIPNTGSRKSWLYQALFLNFILINHSPDSYMTRPSKGPALVSSSAHWVSLDSTPPPGMVCSWTNPSCCLQGPSTVGWTLSSQGPSPLHWGSKGAWISKHQWLVLSMVRKIICSCLDRISLFSLLQFR